MGHNAKKRGVDNIVCSTLKDAGFKKESLESVGFFDVMEHIEEDVKVFENFHASLKKGGQVIISTPSDQGGSDVHGDEDSSFIDEHVRDGYNMQEIKRYINQLKEVVVYYRTMNEDEVPEPIVEEKEGN